MPTKTTLPFRLLWALLLCNLIPAANIPSAASAQSAASTHFHDEFRDFQQPLACPANLEPANETETATAGSAGTQGFDYSLLQRKRQKSASQQRPTEHGAVAEQPSDPWDLGGLALDGSTPLTGQQKKLRAKATAKNTPRYAAAVTSIQEQEQETNEIPYYRSLPEEPELEAPTAALPLLSTALSAYGQAPLQMQTATATTGLPSSVGPMVTSSAASRQVTTRPDPSPAISRARAILARSGGV